MSDKTKPAENPVGEVYRDLPFVARPNLHFMRVVPFDLVKGGFHEGSRLDIEDRSPIGAYRVEAVGPGTPAQDGSGAVPVPVSVGDIVLIRREHVVEQRFGRRSVCVVGSQYAMVTLEKRTDPGPYSA